MFEQAAGNIRNEADGAGWLREALARAEAVVIGAGPGLSAAAGFETAGPRFTKYFGDFEAAYGIHDLHAGTEFPFDHPEEMWAFLSRMICLCRYMRPEGSVYEDLFALAGTKDCFVITTNADSQLRKAGFDRDRLYCPQGDLGLWQCAKPCHGRTYDNKSRVVRMVLSQGFVIGENGEMRCPQSGDGKPDFARISMTVPSDLIPCCPVCGGPMRLNLRRDETFVEDEDLKAAKKRYDDFLEAHKTGKVLFLELGAAQDESGLIRGSLREMAMKQPDALYACIDPEAADAPGDMEGRAVCLKAEIAEVLKELRKQA